MVKNIRRNVFGIVLGISLLVYMITGAAGAQDLFLIIKQNEWIPEVITGDVNGDGGTNIADVLIITQCSIIEMNFPCPQPPIGDVNNDNSTDIEDAVIIAQYTVGNEAITGAIPLVFPVSENPDTIKVGNVTLTTNGSGIIAINVTSVTTNIAALTLRLNFDPSVIIVCSVENGDLGSTMKNINNTAGTLDISVFTVNAATTPPVNIANVCIKDVSKAVKSTKSILALNVSALIDASGVNRVPDENGIINGYVTIGNIMKGDINDDGTVTIVDALFVAQYTVGKRTLTFTQLAAADANGDGQVNAVDALFIAQYTVGLRQL